LYTLSLRQDSLGREDDNGLKPFVGALWVPLREGVISPDGSFSFLEWVGEAKKPGSENLQRLEGSERNELTASLVSALLVSPDQQVLVFVPTVGETRVVAGAIASGAAQLSPAVAILREISLLEGSDATKN
jgi:hypothetical protein